MELTITNNREIKPYKVAVKQFESETTTLVFTRDSYWYDQVDLRNYTAYAVTCIGGAVDMTELTYEVVDGKLVITWVVQEYTLRQAGNITYQIVFKENADEGTGVFYTYEGLLQCSESIDADRPISANYPTILKQWLDHINNLAGTISAGVIYMGVGEPIPVESRLAGRLYYQIEDEATYVGHFEDNLGNKLGTFTADYKVDADINKMITHGEFICAGTVLNPPIDCAFCMVRVTDSLSTNRVIQEVYIPDDSNAVRVFTRAITGTGTFGEWTELTGKLEKNIGTANAVLVTDANGNIIPHPNVSSQELNGLNGYIIGAGTVEKRMAALEDCALVETWKNGYNWYRKYSDGFIEQGGKLASGSSAQYKTVNFATAFSSADSYVLTHSIDGVASYIGVRNRTTTSAEVSTHTAAGGISNGAFWYACGY